MQKLTSERDRIWARHEVYMRERMQIEISDRQYRWWDWVFTTHMESAIDTYLKLIFKGSDRDSRGCLWLGDFPRAKIKFQKRTITCYRFTYGIATVVPLSQTQLMRHECNNPFCINPRHLLTGDQKDNFRDHLATQAYGTRWELLRGWDSM